jgi:hypothetical protein
MRAKLPQRAARAHAILEAAVRRCHDEQLAEQTHVSLAEAGAASEACPRPHGACPCCSPWWFLAAESRGREEAGGVRLVCREKSVSRRICWRVQ